MRPPSAVPASLQLFPLGRAVLSLKRTILSGIDGEGGHTFVHEISMYQIWSSYRVTYLRDKDNFVINVGLNFASLILTH